jgi:hypothetical protein
MVVLVAVSTAGGAVTAAGVDGEHEVKRRFNAAHMQNSRIRFFDFCIVSPLNDENASPPIT